MSKDNQDGGSIADQGFVAFHASMPEKPDTTVRFFDRADYYTVHGNDAIFAAKEIFRSMGVVKYWGAAKLPSVNLSKMNFESMVRDLLLVRHYRVEMYRCKPKTQTWLLIGKASPGNLEQFDELLFSGNNDMSSSAGVVAVKFSQVDNQRLVGVAYADAALRQLGVSEFVDNDQLSNLESLLVQIGPKECILPAGDTSAEVVATRRIMERSKVLISDRKKAEFNTKDIVQDLNRLLKLASSSGAASLPEVELHHAMSAAAALIKYLDLLRDESNFGQYQLKSFSLDQYMKLDVAAVRALNLVPSATERGNGSLLGLLNKCRTPQGQRLLAQWIKQPLLDLNKITERHNVVEVMVDNTELRQSLVDEHLKKIPDFCRLAKRLQRKKASLQDLVRVFQALRRLPALIELLETTAQGITHAALLDELYTSQLKTLDSECSNFIDLVEHTIDMDQIANHEFLIRPSFDENLQVCRGQMDEILEKMPSYLNKAARSLGLESGKTIKLESTSQLGHFFRVTRKDEKSLRNARGFITIDTNKNGVRFTSPDLKSANTELQQLQDTYNSLQSTLAAEVLKVAAGYAEPLQKLNDVIAHLDVLTSFAYVSANAPVPYVRPNMLSKGEGGISLEASRHPCVEVQDNVAFIANDVEFNRDNKMFHIITGPNMGGKSTYIRQTGVIVLMAQLGCFVPCASADISIVDSILVRVGASDSQLKGVSTFMAEMLETAAILRLATSNSLIIIDELGRGTSTYDGFGLAWAISEHIATKTKAFCMFATHFHELTELGESVPAVYNQHVTALTTNDTLTLLYKVKPGVCDQSFGIHVAELAHFPASVVEFARHKAVELEGHRSGKFVCSAGGDGDEPTAKRRKVVEEEGEKIMSDFLAAVEALSRKELPTADFSSKLEELRSGVLSQNNEYVAAVLS
ncbi:DNA mismatch repair protein Msh2-like isoform X2 [Sycon ciliatum]|uniref:DNA mismatch repair protein Msh2-like isoform X2 n=1 Tax=Sycon ciliatum TaxID=27933 RepID=UPI0020ADE81E|eukprot:scpid33175/ scgid8451/ DNA mismatch repair protein Msh2; MutS protein homolog 2